MVDERRLSRGAHEPISAKPAPRFRHWIKKVKARLDIVRPRLRARKQAFQGAIGLTTIPALLHKRFSMSARASA